MESAIYSSTGTKVGSIKLPEHVFAVPWNNDLIHQVVVSMRSNARAPIAHTKDRGEVRGGGKKPWRQKGTGRARHGSSRSPIWIGGGVTFGPRNDRNFSKKINTKMKRKALAMALSQKMRDGRLLFVDTFAVDTPKTSIAKDALLKLGHIEGFTDLGTRRNNAALIAFGVKNEGALRSFRNIGSVVLSDAESMSASDILDFKYLIVTEPSTAVDFWSRIFITAPLRATNAHKEDEALIKSDIAIA